MEPIITVTRPALTPQEKEERIAELRRALAEFGRALARAEKEKTK